MIERGNFLRALAACGVAPAMLAAAPAGAGGSGANAQSPELQPLERALVLSGGGALGAYEAGIVGALAARDHCSDGTPLRDYDMVCGTSIGALNGWFVATGQYAKLRALWYGISGEKLVQPKPKFAAIRDPQSGLVNRAASALSLMGLVKNQTAVLQTDAIYAWIVRNIDPATPLVMPFVWAVTNLTLQRPEFFYMRPPGARTDLPAKVIKSLQVSLGPHTIVREATPELLHRAIFASAALPLAFDPVLMPGPDGKNNAYCDGGVASNSPVGIAHAVARAADVVLLDPQFAPETNYTDAVDVSFGVFGTMQRKILEVEMRNTYFQSLGKRAFERLLPSEVARATQGDALLERFMQTLPVTVLRYIRPEKPLPLGVVSFNDEVGIGKAYQTGWLDATSPTAGFKIYDWETFQL
ncbi:MAG TPA: patatin-like phospholipase family protein [Candidatus Tumulicola sp.]